MYQDDKKDNQFAQAFSNLAYFNVSPENLNIQPDFVVLEFMYETTTKGGLIIPNSAFGKDKENPPYCVVVKVGSKVPDTIKVGQVVINNDYTRAHQYRFEDRWLMILRHDNLITWTDPENFKR